MEQKFEEFTVDITVQSERELMELYFSIRDFPHLKEMRKFLEKKIDEFGIKVLK